MKILLDTLGADLGSKVFVEGAIAARKREDVNIVFIGKSAEIQGYLSDLNEDFTEYGFLDTDVYISNTEQPVKAIRAKKEASIVKGLSCLKENKADGMLSAGSTGALLAGSTFIIGRIQGVQRPALCITLPSLSKDKKGCILLDVGANADCKPEFLQSFAVMGSTYADILFEQENSTVALLNIGAEEGKGNALAIDAYTILAKDDALNFKGNIEGRFLLNNDVDVIVTDGYAGNIALKVLEGAEKSLMGLLKIQISSISDKERSVLVPLLSDIKSKLDYNQYGAAPLLGIAKPVFKAHGSSSAEAIENGIYAIVNFIKGKVNDTIQEQMSRRQ